jgi:hypothetical protein
VVLETSCGGRQAGSCLVVTWWVHGLEAWWAGGPADISLACKWPGSPAGQRPGRAATQWFCKAMTQKDCRSVDWWGRGLQPFILMVFFRDRVSQTICPG